MREREMDRAAAELREALMTQDAVRFRCSGCSAVGDGQGPCEACGCARGTILLEVEERISVSCHAASEKWRGGRLIGFTESLRDGSAGYGDLTEKDQVQYRTVGSSPQGEEDMLPTARRLVAAWELLGGAFREPQEGESDVDAWTVNMATDERIDIQVVRAFVGHEYWHELSKVKRVEGHEATAAVADRLRDAVRLKKDRIPLAQRSRLVLAVDANRTPAVCFDGVLVAFRASYGEWLSRIGFRAVWVVGPTRNLVRRLDELDELAELS